MKLTFQQSRKFLTALSLCVLAFRTTEASAADASVQPTQERPDFSGVWGVRPGYGLRMTKPDGSTIDGHKVVPLQPWARAAAIEQRRLDAEGHDPPNNNQMCLPPGLIRQYKGPFPFMILQTDKEITWLFEENYRVVQAYIDAEHPAHEQLQSSWYGHSVARWEGDTLVIDTIGTNGKTTFPGGIEHTDALHVVHRMRLIENGKAIEDHVRLEDPKAYTAPWEVLTIFDRQPEESKLREAVCAENNQHMKSSSG